MSIYIYCVHKLEYLLLNTICAYSDQDIDNQEEKYIVFRCKLLDLLRRCALCNGPCHISENNRMGTYVSFSMHCPNCDFSSEWSTQPMIKNTPAGNISLSAAEVLFSGGSYSKTARLLKTMNVPSISEGTFSLHSTRFLHPTVLKVWDEVQRTTLRELKSMGGDLVLGGDGRSDSPGHCAKFGSYTMVEGRLNKVIDIQLVQVHAFTLCNFVLCQMFSICIMQYC